MKKQQKNEVLIRQINYLRAGGRIPGAVKMATIWMIPKDAETGRPPFQKYKKIILS